MKAELVETLPIYKAPSQSLWRALELKHLRAIRQEREFEPPVLDIGCADGAFSSLLFGDITCGIDLNSRAIRRNMASIRIYRALLCMDARLLAFRDCLFRTVFANCVIEHIPEVQKVVAEIHRVLQPGGRLVTTVPLREMNRHLLLKSPWYVQMRRRQLCHINLLSEFEWKELMLEAGFARVEVCPYLTGKLCTRWDTMDVLGSVGIGRYKVSNVFRGLGSYALPSWWRCRMKQWLAGWLASTANGSDGNSPCAAIVIGTK